MAGGRLGPHCSPSRNPHPLSESFPPAGSDCWLHSLIFMFCPLQSLLLTQGFSPAQCPPACWVWQRVVECGGSILPHQSPLL